MRPQLLKLPMSGKPAVRLVDSVDLPDSLAVFEATTAEAGDVLRRTADGETYECGGWIGAQVEAFVRAPGLSRVRPERGHRDDRSQGRVQFQLEGGVDPARVALPELGYAHAAQVSFARFSELNWEGTIADGARFQVSLPTPLALVGAYVAPWDKERLEPAIEAAMRREVEAIADSIPNDELAVQWDVAMEIADLERAFPPFFEPAIEAAAERLARVASWVPEEVDLGFHLCCGGAGEESIGPRDVATLAALANAISRATPRAIEWIHMPVPSDRDPAPDPLHLHREVSAWGAAELDRRRAG